MLPRINTLILSSSKMCVTLSHTINIQNPSLEQLEEGDSYPTVDLDFRHCSTACIRNTCLQTNIAMMSLISAANLLQVLYT